MKTFALIAVLAVSFAAAGTAFADGASYDYPQAYSANKTRADVVNELKQARANGTLLASEADFQRNTPFAAQRSRVDVRSETAAALASGELTALNREPHSFDGRLEIAQPVTNRLLAAMSK